MAGTLPTRHCAVIIDEAHSSQGGETATELKEVLGGEDLRREAALRASEEGLDNMAELFRSMVAASVMNSAQDNKSTYFVTFCQSINFGIQISSFIIIIPKD